MNRYWNKVIERRKKMTKIAEFKFTDYDGYDAARNRLYSEVGSGCIDSQTYDDYYYISIWDNCSDPGRASQICSANGGKAC